MDSSTQSFLNASFTWDPTEDVSFGRHRRKFLEQLATTPRRGPELFPDVEGPERVLEVPVQAALHGEGSWMWRERQLKWRRWISR